MCEHTQHIKLVQLIKNCVRILQTSLRTYKKTKQVQIIQELGNYILLNFVLLNVFHKADDQGRLNMAQNDKKDNRIINTAVFTQR